MTGKVYKKQVHLLRILVDLKRRQLEVKRKTLLYLQEIYGIPVATQNNVSILPDVISPEASAEDVFTSSQDEETFIETQEHPPICLEECRFCADRHNSYECLMYGSSVSRRARLLELQRCVFCMKPRHPHESYKCPRDGRLCFRCMKGKHHPDSCDPPQIPIK